MDKKEVARINKSNREFARKLSEMIGMNVTYGYHHEADRYIHAYEDHEGFWTGIQRSCNLYFEDIRFTLRFDCLLEDFYNHENPVATYGEFTIENVLAYFERNKTYRSHSYSQEFFKNCLYVKMKIEDALKPKFEQNPKNKMKI